MRVLIAPDKFKGTLTAQEAARAMAGGWRRARPKDELQLLPISDGGDGFGAILGRLLGARRVTCSTLDAAHRRRRAAWWWHAASRTAIIESAEVIGLVLLPKRKYHPFHLDTYGLARLFAAAEGRGAKRIIIGIGGSATNDGGFGLARGLGWQFRDRAGRLIESWTRADELALVIPPKGGIRASTTVAVDVRNLLLGAGGCTRIYGPQKGMRLGDFPKAEACLRRLARLVDLDSAKQPGAGAAGGLGFGLAAFLGARMVSGFELFAQQARLHERVSHSDLVLTGEGAMDNSTRMGKGVGQLAALCLRLRIPCIGLAGTVKDEVRSWRALADVAGITDYFSPAHAHRSAAAALTALTAQMAGRYGQRAV